LNIVYTTGHEINEAMSTILAKGFDARKRPACVRVTKGEDVTYIPVKPVPGSCSIVYGILRGTGEILHECERQGEEYVYCDHSYFQALREDWLKGNFSGYFRVVRDDRYYRPIEDRPSDRWEKLGLELQPWRTTGSHIVVVPVSKFLANYHGFDAKEWLERTIGSLRQHTDRKIIVKPKDTETPLSKILVDAWALVTLESMAAIDAIMAGIPAFTSVSAAAAPIACQDISQIENPPTPEREQHFWNLAYQQWTAQEIARGEAKQSMGAGGSAKRQECRGSDPLDAAPTLQESA
jgi:hypothetical protein